MAKLWLHKISFLNAFSFLMKTGGFTLPVFNGPNKLLSFLPYRTPIVTVVGEPVDVPRFDGDLRYIPDLPV